MRAKRVLESMTIVRSPRTQKAFRQGVWGGDNMGVPKFS